MMLAQSFECLVGSVRSAVVYEQHFTDSVTIADRRRLGLGQRSDLGHQGGERSGINPASVRPGHLRGEKQVLTEGVYDIVQLFILESELLVRGLPVKHVEFRLGNVAIGQHGQCHQARSGTRAVVWVDTHGYFLCLSEWDQSKISLSHDFRRLSRWRDAPR